MHFVGCLNFEDPCSMKYPPVVSTLEEWLDGKLGIEGIDGIDAVSCAFYVLSLLQRDETNELETFYQFPCSKIVDDQSLSYWPQNSWSNWGFNCYEDSLTAKCVSAPVQRYEIEHLGNDLSPSLKSIESEGGDCVTQGCLCDKQCFSLPVNDKVQRCCQVFSVRGQHPNSNNKEKCNVTSVAECKNSLWANESACVGFCKHKLEGGGLEGKINSSSMAEKVAHEKGEDFWMADQAETGEHLFLHDEKLLCKKKDVNFFSWNTSEELCYMSSSILEKNFKQEEHPDQHQDGWKPGIFCKQAENLATVSMPHVGAGAEYGIQGLSEGAEEDNNLAQLIAKFDHSIAAIWNLGSTHPLPYGVAEEQQNLPRSYHNFVSPPQDGQKMDSFENNLDSSSEENSFIHSGTNIINSIWSDQSLRSNSSQAESELKHVGGGVNNFNNCVNDDHSDLCCKLKVLLTDEILHNEFNLFEWDSGTPDTRIEASKNTSDNYLQVPKECSEVLWDKIESFPTLFANVNFQEQFCRMENFQDADCDNQQNENSCMISCSPHSISYFQGSCQDNVQDTADNGKINFSTLNHNREDSSFTEVLPRHTETKKPHQEINVGNLCTDQSMLADCTIDESTDENKSNTDNPGKEEEEDLLTSARTHFRPIQQENQEPHNNPACSYSDGTTFVISSNFAEVPFKRSESGILFLESDDVPGTSKKYMEYKDKRSGEQIRCAHISKDTLANKEAFIPKFCVRQIEKCCQTDESDESSDELNSKRVKRECVGKERKSNLFFSDDEIAKSVANYLDEENFKFSLNEFGCEDNFEDERMDDISERNAKNDSVSRSLEAEMYIWNRASCKCNNNYMFSSKSDSLRALGASLLGEKDGLWEPASAARMCQSRYSIWSCSPGPQTEPCPACETLTQDKTVQYSQLREELSEDGEQLLSDLSSLQHLQLSTGWLDDALDQGGWGTEPNLLTRG